MTFKVNFLCQKWSESFSIFFIKEYQFRSTFFVIDIFKSLYFLKWCPIFDISRLIQFSKFNNFLWVHWFLGKNISNFVPPFENSTTRIAISSSNDEILINHQDLKNLAVSEKDVLVSDKRRTNIGQRTKNHKEKTKTKREKVGEKKIQHWVHKTYLKFPIRIQNCLQQPTSNSH